MLFVIALFFLCTDAFTATSQKNGYTVIAKSVTRQSTINHIVDYHNRERREFGSVSIQWDPELAKEAARIRANIGCKGNTHCNNCVENLRSFPSDHDVNSWAATNEAWVGSKSPFCWRTGRYNGAHYVSVISTAFDRVGCAANQNCRSLFNQGKVDGGWNAYGCLYRSSNTGETYMTVYDQEFKNNQPACDEYIPASEKEKDEEEENNNNNGPDVNKHYHSIRCRFLRSRSTCDSDHFCAWDSQERQCNLDDSPQQPQQPQQHTCNGLRVHECFRNRSCTWQTKCVPRSNGNNAVDDEGEDEELLDIIEEMEEDGNDNHSSDSGTSGSITAIVVLVVLNLVILLLALLVAFFKR